MLYKTTGRHFRDSSPAPYALWAKSKPATWQEDVRAPRRGDTGDTGDTVEPPLTWRSIERSESKGMSFLGPGQRSEAEVYLVWSNSKGIMHRGRLLNCALGFLL